MTAAPRLRVLVVDDEAAVLRATASLLEAYGFDVFTHAGSDAIPERLAASRADVLLQDVRMPGLDVRALVNRIRGGAPTSRTRIVLFSAGMELDALARELGVEAVEKPYRPEALVAAVRGDR